jgi:hypothetical protein
MKDFAREVNLNGALPPFEYAQRPRVDFPADGDVQR